mgnify:CR=1 FL=1
MGRSMSTGKALRKAMKSLAAKTGVTFQAVGATMHNVTIKSDVIIRSLDALEYDFAFVPRETRLPGGCILLTDGRDPKGGELDAEAS